MATKKKLKFDVPELKYAIGRRKMVSLRLPTGLMKEVEKRAKKKGWTVTDVVVMVLDQYLQQEKRG